MPRIWKALLALWSFLADTAQLAGVEWKAVVGYAMGAGGGTWLIGVITGLGAAHLAVCVTGVMFFVAGASAFSRYRKSPAPPVADHVSIAKEQLQEELRKQARENRAILFEPKKLRFAPPPGQEKFSLDSISFSDLGDRMIRLAAELGKYVENRAYRSTEQETVNGFLSGYAQRVLWLYEEARNRGLRNNYLEQFREDPHTVIVAAQVHHVGVELEKFGNIVKLYMV